MIAPKSFSFALVISLQMAMLIFMRSSTTTCTRESMPINMWIIGGSTVVHPRVSKCARSLFARNEPACTLNMQIAVVHVLNPATELDRITSITISRAKSEMTELNKD